MKVLSYENWWFWLLAAWTVGALLGWLLGVLLFKRQQIMMQAELHETKDERTDLQVRLQKTLAELAAKSADLATAMKSKGVLEATSKSRERDFAAKALEVDAALRKQAALEAALRARENDLVNKSNEYINSIGRLSSLEATLKARESDLVGKSNELVAALARQSTLEAALQIKAGEVAALSAKLQAALHDRSFFESSVQGLTKELETVRAQHETLQGELDLSRMTIATYEKSLKERTTQVGRLEAELERARAELEIASERGSSRQFKAESHASKASPIRRTESGGQRSKIQRISEQRDLPMDEEIEEEPSPRTPATKTTPTREPATRRAIMSTGAPQVIAPQSNNGHDDPEIPSAASSPQRLADIKGVGSTFEKRLFQAGIATFWQLAQLTDEDMDRIFELTPLQRESTDLDKIRKDALALAKKTKTQGSFWTLEPPDDLEIIEGIGKAYEKKLYAAGMWTFEKLGAARVEQLERVINATALRRPNYDEWIEKAKMLAALKKRSTGSRAKRPVRT